MRSMAALLTKKLPSLNGTHARDKLWHPSHGIVFSSTLQTPSASASRTLGTLSLPDNNQESHILIYRSSNDSPAMVNPVQAPHSESKSLFTGPQSNSDVTSCTWEPSSASPALSLNDEAKGNDTNTGKRESQNNSDGADDMLHKPLAFQITEATLRKAREATPGTKESFWSYKMFSGPEGQEVKVHYCKSKHTAEQVAQYFVHEKAIGFDIEWQAESNRKSGIKNNVSLIQIASETRIGLFHIAAFAKDTVSDLVAPTLKKIMEDSNITKVGVSIKADCTRLRNFLEVDPRGIFELSHLYKLVRHSSSGNVGLINKSLVSLSTQAEQYLELPIFKGTVRCSDWSQPLGMDQIIYAASDAYANLKLFDTLESKRKQLRPVPPRPYHAELNLPIRLAASVTTSVVEDSVEAIEPEAKSAETSASTPVSAHEDVAQNIRIEDDLEPDEPISSDRPGAGKQLANSTKSVPLLPKPQALIDAESWATAYRASNPAPLKISNLPAAASFAALRVYRLWYTNSDFSIAEIASMLRQPPLQNGTVAQYILDSIRFEKQLPFERGRLKDALLSIPNSRSMWRFRGLWRMVE